MSTRYEFCNPQDYLTVNGHVRLITDAEFRSIQISEIGRYQDLHNDFSDERVFEWITLYAKRLRDAWSPYIYPHPDLVNKAVEEMRKHRWIESEKAGRSLEYAAELDWIERHGSAFKNYWFPRYTTPCSQN